MYFYALPPHLPHATSCVWRSLPYLTLPYFSPSLFPYRRAALNPHRPSRRARTGCIRASPRLGDGSGASQPSASPVRWVRSRCSSACLAPNAAKPLFGSSSAGSGADSGRGCERYSSCRQQSACTGKTTHWSARRTVVPERERAERASRMSLEPAGNLG